MTSPKNAIATSTGRFYSVPGFSQQMISVTNVLGIIAAPAIINAAAKRAAECGYYERETWEAIEREEGVDAALRYIKEAPKRWMHSRGELGTAVHHACEHPERECSDDVRPYLDAYMRWLERDEPEFVAQECSVFNPEYGYAGTADMIVRLDGKTYIGDIKSGYVADKAALQMCAYARATYVVDGDASKPVPWTIDGAFVLDLKPDKFSVRWCDIGDTSWRAFRAAMCMWEFDQRRDVFGAKWR